MGHPQDQVCRDVNGENPRQKPQGSRQQTAGKCGLSLRYRTISLAEVAPVVELVGIFDPAVADVGAVVHVGDENVFDAGVDLGLGLFHGLAGAATMRTTPEVPATTHWPFTSLTSSMWMPSFMGRLKTMAAFLEKELKVSSSSKGNGGTTMRTPTWKPLRVRHLGSWPLAKFPEEIADGSEHAFLLDADGGIAKAGGEFEGIDAVIVDDAVDVDVADVAFFGEFGLHFQIGCD